VLERLFDRVKDPIGVVQGTTLEHNVRFKDRLQANHIMKNDTWVAVVSPTVEPIVQAVEAVNIIVFSLELGLPLCRAKQLHVFHQVSEMSGWGAPSSIDRLQVGYLC
jgi:hypothetical protein